MTIQEQGELCVRYWHDASGFAWPYSETLSRLQKLNPWFLNTFGKAVFNSGLSNEELREVMQQLGEASGGRFPGAAKDLSAFYDALLSQFEGLTGWTRIAISGASEGLKDARAFAGSALGGGAIIAILALFVFAYAKGSR